MKIHTNSFNNLSTKKVTFCAKSPISKEQLENALTSGLSVIQIAQKYNVSASRIYVLISEYKLQTPRQNKILKAQKAECLNKNMPSLIAQGKTINQIAQELGVLKHEIERWIKIHIKSGLQALRKTKNMELMSSNLTDKEIAERKGIKVNSVMKMRAKYGYSYAKVKEKRNLNLIKEALSQSTTLKDVADKTNLSVSTCIKYIKKYHLESLVQNNQKLLIQEKIRQGKNKSEIAKELNMSLPTLRKRLKKYGLENTFEQNKQSLCEQVKKQSENGETLAQIAKNLGISKRSVSNYKNKS